MKGHGTTAHEEIFPHSRRQLRARMGTTMFRRFLLQQPTDEHAKDSRTDSDFLDVTAGDNSSHDGQKDLPVEKTPLSSSNTEATPSNKMRKKAVLRFLTREIRERKD